MVLTFPHSAVHDSAHFAAMLDNPCPPDDEPDVDREIRIEKMKRDPIPEHEPLRFNRDRNLPKRPIF